VFQYGKPKHQALHLFLCKYGMRYGVSFSKDFKDWPLGCVVIRDFKSEPKGRVLAVIVRQDRHEAEQEAQSICDRLNKYEQST